MAKYFVDGSWKAMPPDNSGCWHIDAQVDFDGTVIDTSLCTLWGKGVPDDEIAAAAHQMAAAPDLYEALQAARDHIGNGYQPPELVEQISAALSKARGDA